MDSGSLPINLQDDVLAVVPLVLVVRQEGYSRNIRQLTAVPFVVLSIDSDNVIKAF